MFDRRRLSTPKDYSVDGAGETAGHRSEALLVDRLGVLLLVATRVNVSSWSGDNGIFDGDHRVEILGWRRQKPVFEWRKDVRDSRCEIVTGIEVGVSSSAFDARIVNVGNNF